MQNECNLHHMSVYAASTSLGPQTGGAGARGGLTANLPALSAKI